MNKYSDLYYEQGFNVVKIFSMTFIIISVMNDCFNILMGYCFNCHYKEFPKCNSFKFNG